MHRRFAIEPRIQTLFLDPRFKVQRVTLFAGSRIPAHYADSTVLVHIGGGDIRVVVDGIEALLSHSQAVLIDRESLRSFKSTGADAEFLLIQTK